MSSSNSDSNNKCIPPSNTNNKMKILICTSNMGNAKPTKSCIESMIPFDGVIDTNNNSPYPLPDYLSGTGVFDEEIGSPFVRVSDMNKNEDNLSSDDVSSSGNQFDIIVIGMQEATFSQGDVKKQAPEISLQDEVALYKYCNVAKLHKQSSILQFQKEFVQLSTEAMANPISAFTTLGAKTVKLGTKTVKLGNKTVELGYQTVDGISNQLYGTTDKIMSPFHAVGANANHLLTNDLFENPATMFGGTRVLHKLIMDQCPSYQCVIHYQRGEMRLMVLVPKLKLQYLTSIQCVAGNTGIGKFLPNKGGIVAHLTMFHTRLSFVTAHLAAHEGPNYYANRCDNMRHILSQAKLGNKYPNAYDASISSHYAFVLGDLNFRIQLPMPMEHDLHVHQVQEYVDQQDWYTLQKHDELGKAIEKGDFCAGFKTLPCHFPPTFKVERMKGFHYKSQRTPSYTDRILWKTAHGLASHITPLFYEPCPSFSSSDHKPIRGAFSIMSHDDNTTHNTNSTQSQLLPTTITTTFPEPMECHFFITDISCKSLNNTKLLDNKVTTLNDTYSTYLTFLTSPTELLPGIKDKNIFDKFCSCPKTNKNRLDPINPSWKDNDDQEIHFISTPSIHPKTLFLNSFLYISVVYSLPAQEDYVIGTVALDLQLLQTKAYQAFNNDFPWDKFYDNTLPPCIQLINCPLRKNGLIHGYLNCNIVMAWYYANYEKRYFLIGATRKEIQKNHKKKNLIHTVKNIPNIFKKHSSDKKGRFF